MWPAELRDLVERYGADVVNEAGVSALRYPAILATKEYEFRAVEKQLTERLGSTQPPAF